MPRRDPARRGRRPEGRNDSPRDREVEAGVRRARAAREPLDVTEVDGTPFPVVEVRNPAHGTRYRVVLPEFPGGGSAMCSCDDFVRRAVGTCKHVEAARLALAAQRSSAGPSIPFDVEWARAIWEDVRARLERAGPPNAWGPRRLRAAGGALLEAADPWGAPAARSRPSRRPAGGSPSSADA